MGTFSIDENCYKWFITKEDYDKFLETHPEVIRCKDCRYFKCMVLAKFGTAARPICFRAPLDPRLVAENGFCFWAKRKS